jgi:beta-lactamase superfamily II metal-dependent hydrolase
MTFREFAHRRLEPVSIWIMIAGIIFLCQPWVAFLHEWSVLVMLIGFIGFNVAIHTPAPTPAETDVSDVGPGTSASKVVQEGRGHG